MRVIGITGGIGAGKTYVSQLIQERYGMPIYDCDTEAKRLTIESADIRQKLIALLGAEVYLTNGQLNKQLLAQYLFANKQNAGRINAIIHPAVRQDFERWREEQQTGNNNSYVLLESAILTESHFDELCDEIIIVTAPMELRIERACQRDKASAEAVTQRIKAQLSDEERLAKISTSKPLHLVRNDGTPLEPQLQNIFGNQ